MHKDMKEMTKKAYEKIDGYKKNVIVNHIEELSSTLECLQHKADKVDKKLQDFQELSLDEAYNSLNLR